MVNPLPPEQENLNRLRAVLSAVQDTLIPSDLDRSLNAVVAGIRKVFGAEVSAAITLTNTSGKLDPSTYRVAGPLKKKMMSEKPRPVSGIGAWVLEHDQAVFEEDLAQREAEDHPPIRMGRSHIGAYACLPLQCEHRLTGTLFVLFQTPFHFDDDFKDSLESFAALAARAVELNRLRQESNRQKQQQLGAIRRISQKLLETWHQSDPISALDNILQDILRQVAEEVFSEWDVSAIVYIYEEDQGFYSGQARGPLQEYMTKYPPRERGTSQYTIERKAPIFVSDTAEMPPGVPKLSKMAVAQGVKAFANLPLLVGEGGQETLVGVLLINLQQPYEFNEERQTMLQLFADQAAIALQNARVHRRRLREQTALQAISEAAISGSSAEAWKIIAQQVVTITKSAYAALWSANFEQKRLELKETYQVDPQWQPRSEFLPLAKKKSINAHVSRTRKPYYSPNLKKEALSSRWYQDFEAAYCVPLIAREQLVGTLYVATNNKNGISSVDRSFIEQLAPHAAMTLYNAALFQAEREQRHQAETLREVAQIVNATLDLEKVADLVLEQLNQVIAYDSASLQLIRGDRRKLIGGRGFLMKDSPSYLLRNVSKDSLIRECVQSRKPLVISHTRQHPAWEDMPQTAHINSWIGVPLVTKGKVIGLLTVDHKQAGYYNEASGKIVAAFANQATLAIRNADLYNHLHELNQVAVKLERLRQEEDVFQTILENVIEIVSCDYCTIFLADQENRLISHLSGGELFDAPPRLSFVAGEGLAGWVYEKQRPLIVKNTAKDKQYKLGPSEKTAKPRSMLLAPLRRGKRTIGVVSADIDRPDAFDENHRRLLDTLLLHASAVLQNIEFVTDFQILHDAANRLAEQPSLAQIYRTAIEAAARSLRCNHVTLFMFDRQRGELVAIDRIGGQTTAIQARQFKLGEGLAGIVAQRRKPLRVNDTSKDKRFVAGNFKPKSMSRSTILAPIMLGKELIGVISADRDETSGFTTQNLSVLETLALDVGIAISVRRQQDRLQTISEFQEAISDILPVPDQLDQIYEKMTGLVDTSTMYIALYNEETRLIEFPLVYERGQLIEETVKVEGHPYATRPIGVRKGLTEWVISHKKPLLIRDFTAQSAQRFEIAPDLKAKLKCCLLAPAMTKGNVVGVIGLQNFDQPGVFNANDRDFLVTIARQAAIALDNARLYDLINNQLHRQIKGLAAVSTFQQKISGLDTLAVELQQIYDEAQAAMSGVMNTQNMFIALYDEATSKIEFPLAYENGRRVTNEGKKPGTLYGPRYLGERKGLTEWVINHKVPLLIEKDFDAWADDQKDIEVFKDVTKCWLGAPMLLRNKVIGVIGLQNFKREGVFDKNHRDLLAMIAGQAAIAIDNARILERNAQILERRTNELKAISKFQQQIINIQQ